VEGLILEVIVEEDSLRTARRRGENGHYCSRHGVRDGSQPLLEIGLCRVRCGKFCATNSVMNWTPHSDKEKLTFGRELAVGQREAEG